MRRILQHGDRRSGFTMVEALVSFGIVGMLVGLLIPAVATVRDASMRGESMNNLKNIMLATQAYAGDRGGRLPCTDLGQNDDPRDSLHFSLLPYLEHGNFYKEVVANTRPRGSNYVLKPYLSPADPSIDSNVATGKTSYPANAAVFGAVHGTPAYLPRSFRDGTSHTITFAEHYGFNCNGTQYNWAWSDAPLHVPRPNGRVVTARRATFADRESGDVYPVTSGDPATSVGSVRGHTFQVRPLIDDCDPRIPQTPHPGGMLVAIGDGHVRTLAKGMKETVFWALVTPSGGEKADVDW